MTKLLDKKEKFDFKQMKRSEIVKSIIEAAGLKAEIDIGDLKDDVIDYTNISSSGSGVAGGEGENIDELVSSICGSETDELTKCKLIHEWLRKNVVYKLYTCSHHNSAEECLKHKDEPEYLRNGVLSFAEFWEHDINYEFEDYKNLKITITDFYPTTDCEV